MAKTTVTWGRIREGLKTQNRGLPEYCGFPFGGRFVLFAGSGKPFVEGEDPRMGLWFLPFLGRRSISHQECGQSSQRKLSGNGRLGDVIDEMDFKSL